MRRLLGLIALLSATALQAQDREADSLRHAFGRQEIKNSARIKGTPYADTLDTGNPAVKVVLYNNGTYRYVKDPTIVLADSVFTECWDTRAVNPYRENPDSIPDRFSIWVVDTLDTYCCPYVTHPRSLFGYRHGRRHQGIDLAYPMGTPVVAAFDGMVRISKANAGGYGQLIVIRHDNKLETYYGHLSQRLVNPGQIVHAGDTIALGGSTGRSTGPHLHFETRYLGYDFNPTKIIDFDNFKLKVDTLYTSGFEVTSKTLIAEKSANDAKAATSTTGAVYHKVRRGETLGSIAKKYHTYVSSIKKLNGLRSDFIREGQRLRVR